VMKSQKIHQYSPTIGGTGVGATPAAWGEFTSPGGGGKPSLASRDGSKRHLRGYQVMESKEVHHSGCVGSIHPGVGVVPGGFTSPGGGGKLSPASRDGSKRHLRGYQ
jgi:hypothetical protein